MKQVLLSGKGEIAVLDVPVPGRLPGAVLVRSAASLISTGTEGASVSRRGGWLGVVEKGVQSTDRVRQVWEMARSRGVVETWAAVQRKLGETIAPGYSCAGQVVEVAAGEAGTDAPPRLRPGDRVACMGAGFAVHAEYVTVPFNLAVPIPDGVSYHEAAFGALASIAVQGVRRLELSPGEWVGVLGLGLIGQIVAQLLPAMGYRAVGVDLDARRAATAATLAGIEAWGAEEADSLAHVQALTGGRGLDGVVVCAASKSSQPVNLAFDLCRKRGRVSLIGDVGLDLIRAKMYRKELDLRMSCSYGPGRYDDGYEIAGRDYPYPYVRWTEGRNLAYALDLLAEHKLRLAPLISHRVPVDRAPEGYARIKERDSDTYGVVIEYGDLPPAPQPVKAAAYVRRHPEAAAPAGPSIEGGPVRLGLIGCGGFTRAVHLPNLARLPDRFRLAGAASRTGATAEMAARRWGIPLSTSDYRVLLDDPQIEAVFVATRHRTHAAIVLDALDAGKHVLVEKPLCLTVEEGEAIAARVAEVGRVLRVGFNRRFSPYLLALRRAVGARGRRTLSCRVNIGPVEEDWSNTPAEGGRLLGEGVHFFDLCTWFVGQEPDRVSALPVGEADPTNPNLLVQIHYPGGSAAQVLYTSLGEPGAGKEFFEALGNGRAARVEDYRRFRAYGASLSVPRRARGDKGHLGELHEFAAAIRGEADAGDGADVRAGLLATWVALAAVQSARDGVQVERRI